jgi:hypothetical protein
MAANHANVVSIAGNGPIATGAYTAVFASAPFGSAKLVIANGTDQTVSIAVGAAGSEVDLVAVATKCTAVVDLSLNQVIAGSRISALAQGAATSTGYLTVSLMP